MNCEKRYTFFLVAIMLVGAGVAALALWVKTREPAAVPVVRRADAVFREWRSVADTDKRGRLAEEIVRERHLIGLTRDHVLSEMGKPQNRRMSPEYGDLKYVVGPSGVDDLWLCIHLKNETVVRAEVRSD